MKDYINKVLLKLKVKKSLSLDEIISKVDELIKEENPSYIMSKNDIEEISNIINGGIDIDYFVKINFKGVVKMVDTLGGVEVDVPYSFCFASSTAISDLIVSSEYTTPVGLLGLLIITAFVLGVTAAANDSGSGIKLSVGGTTTSFPP